MRLKGLRVRRGVLNIGEGGGDAATQYIKDNAGRQKSSGYEPLVGPF